MRLRPFLACLAALALNGCSYGYGLLAVVIDGRLAFLVDPDSNRQPDCVRGIRVSTGGKAVAKAAPGDDPALVASGVYWWRDFAGPGCRNRFPLFYGAPLKGSPLIEGKALAGAVAAKRLRIGVVYDVGTTSEGSGYGSGRFRILPNRKVENLPFGAADAGVR